MRKWVADKIQDARIAWDGLGYERAQRAAHLKEAEQRFETATLERRADELLAPWRV